MKKVKHLPNISVMDCHDEEIWKGKKYIKSNLKKIKNKNK